MAAARPLQVEFFGLPGSGKTTLARELHARLAARDPATLWSPELTRDAAPALPRTLARAATIAARLPWRRGNWKALAAAATVPQPGARDRAKALFALATVSALAERLDRSPHPAVLDQGMLQALWSVHLRGGADPDPGRWRRLLDRETGRGRSFVIVETPPATCIARLDARAGRHSRMQAADALHDAQLWRHAEALRHSLHAALEAAFERRGLPPRILRVDGTRDPARQAAELLAALGPLTLRARPPDAFPAADDLSFNFR